MLIHQHPPFCISSSYIKANINNNEHEKIEIIALQQVNKFIDKSENHNQNTNQDPTQACRGRKYICLIYMRSTENFQSHLNTSFIINEI